MKKLFSLVALVSLLSAPVQADQCTEVVGLQALDVLSQELMVSFEHAAVNWTGYEEKNVKLVGKSGELELYSTKIKTDGDVYLLDLSVDSMCDVVDYKIKNESDSVRQCVQTCYAFYSKPSVEFKYCVASCKGQTLNDSSR